MNQLLAALVHTPWWVFIVLGYLLWVGIDALKTQTVPVTRICILPLVISTWDIYSFVIKFNGIQTLLIWLLSITIGIVMGIMIAKFIKTYPHKNKGLITVTGNSTTLILLLMIFVVKYFFGYVDARNLFFEHKELIAIARIGSFAIISGIFIGRALWWGYQYHISSSRD